MTTGTAAASGSEGVGGRKRPTTGRASASGTAAVSGKASASLHLRFYQSLVRQQCRGWRRRAFLYGSSRAAWVEASGSAALLSGWRPQWRRRKVAPTLAAARMSASGTAAARETTYGKGDGRQSESASASGTAAGEGISVWRRRRCYVAVTVVWLAAARASAVSGTSEAMTTAYG